MALPLYLAKAATAALVRQMMKKGLTRSEAIKAVAQTKTPRQLQKVGMKEGIDKAGKKAGDAYQELLKMNKKKTSKLTKAKISKDTIGPVAAGVAIPSSTGGKKTSTSEPKYSLPTVDVPSQITMSKGGKVKKKGVRRADGCAVRGKTRGRMI